MYMTTCTWMVFVSVVQPGRQWGRPVLHVWAVRIMHAVFISPVNKRIHKALYSQSVLLQPGTCLSWGVPLATYCTCAVPLASFIVLYSKRECCQYYVKWGFAKQDTEQCYWCSVYGLEIQEWLYSHYSVYSTCFVQLLNAHAMPRLWLWYM